VALFFYIFQYCKVMTHTDGSAMQDEVAILHGSEITMTLSFFLPLPTQNALELPLSTLGATSSCTPSTELLAQLVAE
jgi:hypothetical protein